MTVKELIKLLLDFDGELSVVIWKRKRGYPGVEGAGITQTKEDDGTSETVLELLIED